MRPDKVKNENNDLRRQSMRLEVNGTINEGSQAKANGSVSAGVQEAPKIEVTQAAALECGDRPSAQANQDEEFWVLTKGERDLVVTVISLDN